MSDSVSKTNKPGCLIDEPTFRNLVEALCKLTKPSLIQSTLSNADIHDNGASVQFAIDTRADPEWSRAGNVFSYTGEPDHVQGFVSINAPDTGASNYWARPKLRVLRGGSVIAIIDDLVMQANGTYDGDATVNGSFFDAVPGVNPSYTFEWFDKENRTATVTPEPFSSLTLKAEEKVTL